MVDKLTKEQEDAIIPFQEYWISRILRTEQSDGEIKENIKGIYKLAGLEEPKHVWIMDSMFGVQVAINFLKNCKEVDIKNIESNIKSNIWSNIESNIWSNIWSNIESNIESNISNIWLNIRSNINSNINSNIWSNIESNIKSNIWSNIESNIESNIRSNIWSNIRSNIESNIKSNIWSNKKLEYFGFSSNDGSWLHWYIYQKYYFDNGLLPKDKYSELLESYISMCIDAWSVYYSPDIAIVSRKPEIARNDRGLLHSDEKPAVSFKDGYELYYLNGVNFPKELWEKVVSRKMNLKEIMEIQDIDQRTQAMAYVEIEEMLTLGKVVDEYKKETIDGKEVKYRLVRFDDLFPVKAWFAVYNCPSTQKLYMSGIDPEIGAKEDVKLSMAWKQAIRVEDFINMIPLVHES